MEIQSYNIALQQAIHACLEFIRMSYNYINNVYNSLSSTVTRKNRITNVVSIEHVGTFVSSYISQLVGFKV